MEVCHNIVSAGQWNDHSFTLGQDVTIDGEFIMEALVKSCHSGDTTLSIRPTGQGECAPLRGWGPIVSAPILIRCLGVKANIDMALTQRSNLISVFVLDGRQLRASTRSISLPGWYMMTRSYCCRWRSILWRCAGATVRFFRLIISRGLWSISTMNVLPYRYVWNFSQPYMMAKSSLLMLA